MKKTENELKEEQSSANLKKNIKNELKIEKIKKEEDAYSTSSSEVECICGGKEKDDKAICCDLCGKWFHCGCLGISNSFWKQNALDETIRWECPECFLNHQTTSKKQFS